MSENQKPEVLPATMAWGNRASAQSQGTKAALTRFSVHPKQAVHSLLVEYNSLCFNPRGQLYKKNPLQVVLYNPITQAVREAFAVKLGEIEWGFYKVRRIYSKKGKAIRAVELIVSGSRKEAQSTFETFAHGLTVRDQFGIKYAYFQERNEKVYPAFEGFYVIAPLFMKTKVRGPIDKFEERWDEGLRKLAVAETKADQRELVEAAA